MITTLPVIKSFSCKAREDACALILGTMPSAASLAAGNYYAHPRNAFWPIIHALLGAPLDPASLIQPTQCDWATRYALLRDNHIALWDVARVCSREASADASIRDAEPNDIPALLEACPNVHMICFNGQKAASLFRSLVLPRLTDGQRSVTFVTLPSTSPARAIPFATKLTAWRVLTAFLETNKKSFQFPKNC